MISGIPWSSITANGVLPRQPMWYVHFIKHYLSLRQKAVLLHVINVIYKTNKPYLKVCNNLALSWYLVKSAYNHPSLPLFFTQQPRNLAFSHSMKR
ncbi:Uncharacterised protein [Acinetobacter baumannii]|nr:Uncharacterised protein [Acinetobacter baumannii]